MRRLLLAIALILLLPSLANAQTFPAFTQTDTYSNIGWSVYTTRGWSFTVSSRIVVEQLGFWDSGQDGLATAHGVGIWRGDGTLLTSTTVPAGNGAPLDGTFRWSPTSAVELLPGNTYVVGAYWSAGNPDTTLAGGESVVFDSRVNLVGGRAINTVGLFYPAQTASVDLTASFKAHSAQLCGDGETTPPEQCDEGYLDDPPTNGDGCSATCQVEVGWICEGMPSVCVLAPPVPALPRSGLWLLGLLLSLAGAAQISRRVAVKS